MGRFKVEQINRLAARFVWVSQAITYVLNTDEDGHVAFVDPLGTPPPVDLDWSPSTTPWVRESEIPAVGPQRSSRDASLRRLVTLLIGGATGCVGHNPTIGTGCLSSSRLDTTEAPGARRPRARCLMEFMPLGPTGVNVRGIC